MRGKKPKQQEEAFSKHKSSELLNGHAIDDGCDSMEGRYAGLWNHSQNEGPDRRITA